MDRWLVHSHPQEVSSITHFTRYKLTIFCLSTFLQVLKRKKTLVYDVFLSKFRIIDNVRGELQKRQWIIFDGDVDPEWVENLNSVLDDNKLLTLPNGERLSLPPNVGAHFSHTAVFFLMSLSQMVIKAWFSIVVIFFFLEVRVMFEVQDLKYATLATVSRCGMVWFSEDVLSTDMIFNNFLARIKSIPLDEGEDEAQRLRKGTDDEEETASPMLQVKKEKMICC